MRQIKKAVIPAAGLGTRFLPATKTVPKEMLTIVDKPIILYVVEEAVRAGIEDIILIAGRGKHAIDDFFDCSYELEDTLAKAGKHDLLQTISRIKDMANIISVRQKTALGLGHAVYCSRTIVGNDPFAVLLGDEIMLTDDSNPTATETLCKLFDESQLSTVAVMDVAPENVNKYGIIDYEKLSENLFKVKDVVEKPKPENAPSNKALPGRYTFTANIFNKLENLSAGVNGEIQLTDAMSSVAKEQGMYATMVTSKRYDAGDKLGFIQANIEIALKNPELKPGLKKYLKQLVGTL